MTGPLTSSPAPIAPLPRTAPPLEVARWLREGAAVLIDVREPDEHARERIAGATPLPLSRFDPHAVAALASPGAMLVFHCKSGRRSADACRLAAPALPVGARAVSLAGGIEAWKGARLPTVTGAAPILSVMRQVQLVVGLGVLLSVALGWLVHPGFLGLAAFFGAGLTFAGATGSCGLAAVLSRMPWNRAAPAAQAATPSAAAPTGGARGGSCACNRR